ncbi:hypothetical protein EIP91_007109 [Steccherinum ochraceum]|uniref:Intradiol ring-cleavage dioxygenases domain-containing protein n=1 Tax=Steccherinum ochraceum TaxID=92696 RepID=A0A4R0R4K9_9APHY|nr:hypothetical protein EIP91_007109 [Steccherinum ochraceum]
MSYSSSTATTLASDVVKQGNGGSLVHRVPLQSTSSPTGQSHAGLTIPDTLTGKAPYQYVPFLRQMYFLMRALYVMFVVEFPLLWHRMFQGARNSRADAEGPFYISGAPNVQIAEGKAVIASREDLEENPPYLLSLRIVSPSGKPVPYATVDFWQATIEGLYYNSKYRLRGVFKTDADGRCEVLTILPGAYGFGQGEGGELRFARAGHFHLRISPPETGEMRNLERLTSQIYVCPKNDPAPVFNDFVNYLRPARPQNMIESWASPAFYPSLSTPPYATHAAKFAFPPIPPTRMDVLKSIEWWNTVLAERFVGGQELKVMATGETSIALNKQPLLYLY